MPRTKNDSRFLCTIYEPLQRLFRQASPKLCSNGFLRTLAGNTFVEIYRQLGHPSMLRPQIASLQRNRKGFNEMETSLKLVQDTCTPELLD